MKNELRIVLQVTAEEGQRLEALQAAFAAVCNALAPLVQQNRCWHRVTLHHLAYKPLREQFPQVGSQMICNAIYAVSRTGRVVYQHPDSPFNVARLGEQPLPRLRFAPDSPVYFDRHTLSITAGQLSLYTLDGRIRFALDTRPLVQAGFQHRRLLEAVLSRRPDRRFELNFRFADEDEDEGSRGRARGAAALPAAPAGNIPQYVQVEPTP